MSATRRLKTVNIVHGETSTTLDELLGPKLMKKLPYYRRRLRKWEEEHPITEESVQKVREILALVEQLPIEGKSDAPNETISERCRDYLLEMSLPYGAPPNGRKADT